MTIAEMIAQRTAALRTVLHDSGQAIHAKGGTPADDLSGLQDAILSIPSGGGDLPELTTPAEVGHVLAGKEYIDASGAKKAGTLVVCDSVVAVEDVGIAGTGVSLELESTADGSTKTMTLPEPNLLPENIKNGVSIFGIAGSAEVIPAGSSVAEIATGNFTLAAATLNKQTIAHGLSHTPNIFGCVIAPDGVSTTATPYISLWALLPKSGGAQVVVRTRNSVMYSLASIYQGDSAYVADADAENIYFGGSSGSPANFRPGYVYTWYAAYVEGMET